jgi:hypothetical protein
MDNKSKFIYFTNFGAVTRILKESYTNGINRFKHKYISGYVVNFWSDAFGRMLPIVYDMVFGIMKRPEDDPSAAEKWSDSLKTSPVMRIRVAPATCTSGNICIASTDTILVDFYESADLNDYDKKVDEWLKRNKETGNPGFIDANIKFGKNFYSAVYSGDGIENVERTLYEKIMDHSILDKLVKINENWDVYNSILKDRVL